MELEFANNKIEKQCNSFNAAKQFFNGQELLAKSLLARINAFRNAETIKDIIVQPAFRFHSLKNKKGKNYEGYFAVDVKSVKEPWRIIIQPLDIDNNKQPYYPCDIDKIALKVRIIKIKEVSNHYE